jgi:hypothetical protein
MAPVGKGWSKGKAACLGRSTPGRGGALMATTGRRGIAVGTASASRPTAIVGIGSRRLCRGSWNDGCESCERDVGLREGSYAARRYQFVACGVAEAVVALGAGSTYRDMALVAAGASRAAAGGPGRGAAVLAARVAGDGLGGGVRAGRFEAYRPTAGPATGSLLLDDLPFRMRNPQTGRTRIAFRIFAAMGYERARAKLWRLEAFTSKSQPDWEAFLGALSRCAAAGCVR